jgi:hypothetical protein
MWWLELGCVQPEVWQVILGSCWRCFAALRRGAMWVFGLLD